MNPLRKVGSVSEFSALLLEFLPREGTAGLLAAFHRGVCRVGLPGSYRRAGLLCREIRHPPGERNRASRANGGARS
jgi:hypothetical protein